MPGIDACLLDAMTLSGAQGAALVDWTSGLALGTVGEPPRGDHETTAAEAAELVRLTVEQSVFAPQSSPGGADPAGGGGVEDLLITSATHYHLLRVVESALEAGVFLHIWLGRAEGNLALARIRLRELTERLVLE
ncbi:hypothetical protein ACFV3R_30525 [Streptomyces sp. NPDC059740]|uniref:hypothetical protein n=1 Tax=Streptomyces sp. NPDC059740 TaxID=3346926 RepID=UPI00364AB6CC